MRESGTLRALWSSWGLGVGAGGRGTWGVPLRDGSLREKGVGVDPAPFFSSVRFIHAQGLPMHRALLSLVVALG
jgi:hypothetical protein